MEETYFLDYDLPPERIAQHSISVSGRPRSASKLLLARGGAELQIEDSLFSELPQYLRPNDILVLNDTRVRPSRFFSRLKQSGSEVEIFLLEKKLLSSSGELQVTQQKEQEKESHKEYKKESPKEYWEALAKPLRKLRVDDELLLSERLTAKLIRKLDLRGGVLLELTALAPGLSIDEIIEEEASIPIPPYIRKGRAEEEDKVFYQTVFGKNRGSLAAPTAGLHFTEDLFQALKEKGVVCAFLTLHVGQASFLPVENVDTHQLPVEHFTVSQEVRAAIKKAKALHGRVIAVGTTTLRALESDSGIDGRQETALFIKPGFLFQQVDALVTNFHQPRSSHLLLVQAFIGKNETRNIYHHALKEQYRFLSFGDAMFLERKL